MRPSDVTAVAERILPVWLVPPMAAADMRRVEFAADVLTISDDRLRKRLDPRGVVLRPYLGVDGLRTALEQATRLLPGARLHALVDAELAQEAVPVAHAAGATVELLQTGPARWVDEFWAAVTLRTGVPEPSSYEQPDDALAPHAQNGPQAAPVKAARDETRRRQQQDENERIQGRDTGAMVPSGLTVEEMIERCVYIAERKCVAYVGEDRTMFLTFDELRGLTTSARTEVAGMQRDGAAKKVPNWKLWHEDLRRKDAMTRTFRAGEPNITANPHGLRAVNTWRPTTRWPAKADIGAFLGQVAYLFADLSEREVFLNWLAHIEQKPGELPHYGWLHIAENTGTGRNWMASVLARVFRGYVAPNVDLPALLDSQYNGELSERLLAIVDEVQEGASEGNYRHAERLKSMINAEMRTVNHKYGMKYTEFNACRWLVFSNHKNALPLNDEDRRFRVVVHQAKPRSPDVYEHLYALLDDPEFINAIGVFLRERDISGFKPGERPPLNEAKRAAIAASKPMSTQNAEQIVTAWPADVIANKHVVELMTDNPEKKDFTPAMRRAMEEAGAQSWRRGERFKMGGGGQRAWVLRNHEWWLAESADAIRKEISRAGVDEVVGRPASVVLAEAAEKMGGLHDAPF